MGVGWRIIPRENSAIWLWHILNVHVRVEYSETSIINCVSLWKGFEDKWSEWYYMVRLKCLLFWADGGQGALGM